MQMYECKQCGAKFEQADSCGCACSCEESKCPQCGSTDLMKVEGKSNILDILRNMDAGQG